MWRKIRRFYWYRRDRGLGKQTIAMAVMFLFMVIILAGAIAKSVVPRKDLRNEAEIPANTATGPAVSTSTVLCQNRGCKSAKKLTYQQTKNRFDVTSFIFLSDGSVYQCDYNLKSCAVKLSQTGYTE